MNALSQRHLNDGSSLEVQMVGCVVCQYWSERLEETRTHGREEGDFEQEGPLMVALRTHQFGACALRFPDLLSHLVNQELDPQDTAPGSCDLGRARILTDSATNSERCQPTGGSNNLAGEFRFCRFSVEISEGYLQIEHSRVSPLQAGNTST